MRTMPRIVPFALMLCALEAATHAVLFPDVAGPSGLTSAFLLLPISRPRRILPSQFAR